MTEGMPLRDNVASTYMSPNIQRVQRATMHESHPRTPWNERGSGQEGRASMCGTHWQSSQAQRIRMYAHHICT